MKSNVQFKQRSSNEILKDLGIDEQGKVQQFLGKTVADTLKAYVSFKTGTQQRMTVSTNEGKYVEIQVPYARFQAEGKVMIGMYSHSPWARRGESKVVTDRNLKYHSGGQRGSHPFERMKSDKANSILTTVNNYARSIAR